MGPQIGEAMEFLSQVLSQRGPDAVPYQENVKWTIREHLSELLKMFPTLTLCVNEFHTNDGRIHNLLKAEGTVPIHFQGTKYNIPIVAWLPERYPMSPPLVYVTPTPNMIVKQGHSFVDSSGLVRSPYIGNWLFPSSDLSTMTQEMAMLFGTEPPLYSKPPGYSPPPVPQPGAAPVNGYSPGPAGYSTLYPGQHQYQQQQHQQQHQQQQQQPGPGPYAGMAAGPASSIDPSSQHHAAAGWGAYAGTQPQRPPQQQPPPQQQEEAPGAAAMRQLQGDFRALVVKAIASRLQTAGEAYNRHAAGEMERLLGVQRSLVQRDQELQRVVSTIQQERAGTEGLVAELGAKCAALEKWLDDNEWKVAATADAPGSSGAKALDVNKVIVPADSLSRQALGAQAEDLAIEDALTALDRALHAGMLAGDAYIKQVRLLCRRQFFARAMGLKVAATQRAAAPPRQQAWQGGAGAAGGGGYPLTVGDGWVHVSPMGGGAAAR